QTGDFPRGYRVIAHIGGNDLRGQFDEITVDRIVTHELPRLSRPRWQKPSIQLICKPASIELNPIFKTIIRFQTSQEKENCHRQQYWPNATDVRKTGRYRGLFDNLNL